MPDHPPIEFRYFKIAEDFPARPALEFVLGHVIDAKRDAMAASSVSEAVFESALVLIDGMDDKQAAPGAYPHFDIWMRFAVSHDDYLAQVADKDAAGDVVRFEIEQLEDAEHGIVGDTGDDDEDAAGTPVGTPVEPQPDCGEDGDWRVFIKSVLMFHYSAASLALQFTQGPLGGPIKCTCWVCYAEGDGDDLVMAAGHLGYRPAT